MSFTSQTGVLAMEAHISLCEAVFSYSLFIGDSCTRKFCPTVRTNSLIMLLYFRPLEHYIRSVEKVYRSSDKNQKKGLLSIDMNDRVSKTNSREQEGVTGLNKFDRIG